MKSLRQNLNLKNNIIVFVFIFFNSLCQSQSIRLPTSIQPIKYDLHITTSIHEDILDFMGNVFIEFVVKESTNEIVLHAKKLHNLAISLRDVRSKRRIENLKYSMETEKDFLRITAPRTLQSGERHRLEINYIGKIQEEFYGIYKTSYFDEHFNKSVPLAATLFQPSNARLAFPCFDEPAFRAKFVITITHGRFYTALSNMPMDGPPRWNNNMITTTFRETPPMPTFLVGFVICNFHHSSYFENGIEHRVFYPPIANDTGSRALTNSVQSVEFLDRYLGIKYPFPKLDHIHVKDADMVAMDWGLAIYNDNEFLTTIEDRDSTVKRVVLQNYIIAQQWFANMVSLKWWSYLWINSALGTYFSYKITDLIYPTWKMEEYFIVNEIDELFKLKLNEPLVRTIQSQENVERFMSDDSLCQFGAGILKMFSHAIGNETFTKGLTYYLKKYNNSSVDEDDFFGSIQSAVAYDNVYLFLSIKTSLPKVMKTWTNNRGWPIIKVIRNFNSGTITILQKSSVGNNDEKWWIPINFATSFNSDFNRTTADYIMPPQAEVTITIEDINISLMDNEWLILNKQQTGLYNVMYDDENLNLIAEALNSDHTRIHMLNRALLFRDFKTVLDNDLGAIEPLFEILKYLKKEQESLPWFEASELINKLWSRLENRKPFELFKSFIRDIIGNFYKNFSDLPLYKLSFADSTIKSSIFKLACKVDLDECLAHAKHQTKEYLNYNWPIDEKLKKFTLCKGMQFITAEELGEILEKLMYRNVNAMRRKDFLKSTECLNSTQNIDLVFDFVHDGERTTFKQEISNYMMIYHTSFHEKLRSAWKIRKTRQVFSPVMPEESKIGLGGWKFREKYEESIYNWLKNYKPTTRH